MSDYRPNRPPDVSILKEPVSRFVLKLQQILKEKGSVCTPGRWYPRKGVDFFKLFAMPTCGWPKGVFIDSSEWRDSSAIFIKIYLEPLVVEGYKIGGRPMPVDMDGWTVNYSRGWEKHLEDFMETPYLLLTDLLAYGNLLGEWQKIIAAFIREAAANSDLVSTALQACGFDSTGLPVDQIFPKELCFLTLEEIEAAIPASELITKATSTTQEKSRNK